MRALLLEVETYKYVLIEHPLYAEKYFVSIFYFCRSEPISCMCPSLGGEVCAVLLLSEYEKLYWCIPVKLLLYEGTMFVCVYRFLVSVSHMNIFRMRPLLMRKKCMRFFHWPVFDSLYCFCKGTAEARTTLSEGTLFVGPKHCIANATFCER